MVAQLQAQQVQHSVLRLLAVKVVEDWKGTKAPLGRGGAESYIRARGISMWY